MIWTPPIVQSVYQCLNIWLNTQYNIMIRMRCIYIKVQGSRMSAEYDAHSMLNIWTANTDINEYYCNARIL